MGVPQHHKPLVHGLTVGPTPNPLLLLRIILLRRYDLPVLYSPATETTPIGPGTDLMNYWPSLVRMYSK